MPASDTPGASDVPLEVEVPAVAIDSAPSTTRAGATPAPTARRSHLQRCNPSVANLQCKRRAMRPRTRIHDLEMDFRRSAQRVPLVAWCVSYWPSGSRPAKADCRDEVDLTERNARPDEAPSNRETWEDQGRGSARNSQTPSGICPPDCSASLGYFSPAARKTLSRSESSSTFTS